MNSTPGIFFTLQPISLVSFSVIHTQIIWSFLRHKILKRQNWVQNPSKVYLGVTSL